MKETTHKYSWVYRIIYRYGNIAATLLLLLYLLPNLVQFNQDWSRPFFSVLILGIIGGLNYFFIKLYKTTPYHITINEERITARDYAFNKGKEVVMELKDVKHLSGGIFSGKANGPMRVIGKDETTISFFHTISDSKMLEATVLSRVPKDVYENVLNELGMRRNKLREKAEKRK